MRVIRTAPPVVGLENQLALAGDKQAVHRAGCFLLRGVTLVFDDRRGCKLPGILQHDIGVAAVGTQFPDRNAVVFFFGSGADIGLFQIGKFRLKRIGDILCIQRGDLGGQTVAGGFGRRNAVRNCEKHQNRGYEEEFFHIVTSPQASRMNPSGLSSRKLFPA